MMTAGFYDAAAAMWILLIPVVGLVLADPTASRSVAAWLLAWSDGQVAARRMRAERLKIYREMYLPESSGHPKGGETVAPPTLSEAK